MFNIPPEKPRASGFSTDSYGFSDDSWARFEYSQMTSSSSAMPADPHHDPFAESSGMDWVSSPSAVQADYHQDHHEDTEMELETLSSPQTGGGGVGRLVAHFENKGFNPFDNKTFSPPLPPRPANNGSATNHGHQDYQHHQHHQQTPQNHHHNQHNHHSHHSHHQTINHGPSSPPLSVNDFQSSLSFEALQFCPSSLSGVGQGSFNPNRIGTPLPSPGESSWASFSSLSRVTSPIATSPPPVQYGSFSDNQRVASPGVASSSGQFGSLDGFMSSNRVQSPIAPSPMVSTPVNQTAPTVGGTPGFAIWRPPGTENVKTENPSPPSNATNSAGYFKPPVPTTPKPNITVGNQFILELNPSSKAKGKIPAKPPAKPPRPKAPPPVPTPFSPGAVKQEPATPKPSDLLSLSATSPTPEPSTGIISNKQGSAPVRGQAGTRPSREQVPAEAWEQLKGTIRTLYLEERKPLKEVMSIMADKHNFQATPKMYKTRFSQWGFVKNNTEDEVKRLLSMKFQRDAEGKVSEFVRNGRVVNLGTYLKRKGVTEYDLVDFELPADLPSHIRCRTPTPPPTPGYLRSPDLLRAQELVVGNMRKAFLHCRQFEVETDARIGWPVTMVWGAGSSDLLVEANFYFEARDADQGGDFLMKAFKQLELDLKKLSPLGINELLLGMVNRDPGMMTALCKYLAAYSSTNFERSHPLRQIFTCLYEVQQKHGSSTVSELLWGSVPTIAEELEAIYSRRHPYVARTWIDLALFYNHANAERLEKLVMELRPQQRQVEQRYGANSAEALTLRYSILQLLYAANPQSDLTKQSAQDMWSHLKGMGVLFPLRDSKPNVYCYHSPVKVDPWTKRCRRRYDSGVAILEEHVGVRIHPYFEEDFHDKMHAPDSQEAWSSALDSMGGAGSRFAYI